jgi:hypothetical protein
MARKMPESPSILLIYPGGLEEHARHAFSLLEADLQLTFWARSLPNIAAIYTPHTDGNPQTHDQLALVPFGQKGSTIIRDIHQIPTGMVGGNFLSFDTVDGEMARFRSRSAFNYTIATRALELVVPSSYVHERITPKVGFLSRK